MLRLRQAFLGSPSRWFVSTRGISTGLALALALSYTKILGVEKRSVLAFIMISALILTFLLTSGISLALRNKNPNEIQNSELFGYLLLVLIAGLFVAVFNCLLLLLYSNLKTHIALPLYVICFAYSFFACVNMGFQDALLAKGNLKFATIFDFVTVVIQICTMIIIVKLGQNSLIVSVFLAFIVSYALIIFATGTLFLRTLALDAKLLTNGIKSIITQSRNQHLFGIANGLVDRVDRFLIGLLLPIGFLAKYALLSSIISFARFFPDSAVKLNLLMHHQSNSKVTPALNPRIAAFIVMAGIIFALAAQVFIKILFGKVWILPLSVGFLFVTQEILRGLYQLKAIHLIAIGGKSVMSHISMLLIILSIAFITAGTFFFGVWGAPAAMALVYLILIVRVNSKVKRILNAS